MVAADDDRRLELAARHHLVEGQAEPMPVAKADPADARRQALELDPLARHVEPVVQMRVVRQQLLHLRVGAVDVLRIAGERGPAERADAAAEQRADVGRHEAGESEGVGDALVLRHLPDVVAVVEGRHAAPVRTPASPARARPSSAWRPARPPWDRCSRRACPFGERPARGQIAVDRVVRRGLVGDRVRPHAAAHELRQHLGGVAEQADGDRLSAPGTIARSSRAPRPGLSACASR